MTLKIKSLVLIVAILFPVLVYGQKEPLLQDKIEGMLIGSAIGDAAGGPLEFVHPPKRGYWAKTGKRISQEGIRALADSFKLRSYKKNAEPFAQWEPFAPAGTITDDTRFKLIFFNTIKNHHNNLNVHNFAFEVMDFRNQISKKYQFWFDKWIPEIAYATRWALGQRKNAYPTERIWGGLPTMEGQMPFLPIAALYPEDAQKAYLKTWELGYFDVGVAKDMNAGLVAGLVGALQKNSSWGEVGKYMRETDPYNFNNVLYVPRRLTEWIDKSHWFVQRADGNIAKLFQILETELQTKNWWEAWVPIVVVFSCAEIVNYSPLASMQLVLEFGHDTDSYAQVMGALMGAIHGKDVFPEDMRNMVNSRMKAQYGQNINNWLKLIKMYKSGLNVN